MACRLSIGYWFLIWFVSKVVQKRKNKILFFSKSGLGLIIRTTQNGRTTVRQGEITVFNFETGIRSLYLPMSAGAK